MAAALTFQFWNDRSYQSYEPPAQRFLNRCFHASPRDSVVDLPGGTYVIMGFENLESGGALQVNAATGYERSVTLQPPYVIAGAQPLQLPSRCIFQCKEDRGWFDYPRAHQRELLAWARSAPQPAEVIISVGGNPHWICDLDKLTDAAGNGVLEGASEVDARTKVRRPVRVVPDWMANPGPPAAARLPARRPLAGHGPGPPALRARPHHAAGAGPAHARGPAPAWPPAASSAAPAAGLVMDFSLRGIELRAVPGPPRAGAGFQPADDGLAISQEATDAILRAWTKEPRPDEVQLPSGHLVRDLSELEANGAMIFDCSRQSPPMHVQCRFALPLPGSIRLPDALDIESCDDISTFGRRLTNADVANLVQAAQRGDENRECAICRCELCDDATNDPQGNPQGSGNPDAALSEVFQLHCGHAYHCGCLSQWFEQRRRCPECMQNYGKIVGAQPREGTMDWQDEPFALPGHPGVSQTFVIVFDFPPGVDPSGQSHKGRRLKCYLPCNLQGVVLLELYKVAFKRCVMFGIGNSMTTGSFCPTFNIHVKTNSRSFGSSYGFPDPEYFPRCLEELRTNGVLVSDLPK